MAFDDFGIIETNETVKYGYVGNDLMANKNQLLYGQNARTLIQWGCKGGCIRRGQGPLHSDWRRFARIR